MWAASTAGAALGCPQRGGYALGVSPRDRPSPFDDASRLFTHTFRVRYAETDPMGFVHNSNYLTYLEMARIEALRQRGISYREMEEGGALIVVARAELRFKAPARIDDVLEHVCDPTLCVPRGLLLIKKATGDLEDGTIGALARLVGERQSQVQIEASALPALRQDPEVVELAQRWQALEAAGR